MGDGGKYTQQTDPSGNVSLTDIPLGTYNLRVRRDGYRLWEQAGVTLHPGTNEPLNVALPKK